MHNSCSLHRSFQYHSCKRNVISFSSTSWTDPLDLIFRKTPKFWRKVRSLVRQNLVYWQQSELQKFQATNSPPLGLWAQEMRCQFTFSLSIFGLLHCTDSEAVLPRHREKGNLNVYFSRQGNDIEFA